MRVMTGNRGSAKAWTRLVLHSLFAFYYYLPATPRLVHSKRKVFLSSQAGLQEYLFKGYDSND